MRIPRFLWRFLSDKQKCDQAISRIREHLAFFGIDVENMTDQELEQSLFLASRICAGAGITVEEAVASLHRCLGTIPQPFSATDQQIVESVKGAFTSRTVEKDSPSNS